MRVSESNCQGMRVRDGGKGGGREVLSTEESINKIGSNPKEQWKGDWAVEK